MHVSFHEAVIKLSCFDLLLLAGFATKRVPIRAMEPSPTLLNILRGHMQTDPMNFNPDPLQLKQKMVVWIPLLKKLFPTTVHLLTHSFSHLLPI